MKDHREREPDPCAEAGHARRLLSVDDAIRRALDLACPVEGTEIAVLENAIGRVLADDLSAPMALPPFDNSAMDGYALRSSDLDGLWSCTVACCARYQ